MQQVLLFNTGKTTCSETPAQQVIYAALHSQVWASLNASYLARGCVQSLAGCLSKFKGDKFMKILSYAGVKRI